MAITVWCKCSIAVSNIRMTSQLWSNRSSVGVSKTIDDDSAPRPLPVVERRARLILPKLGNEPVSEPGNRCTLEGSAAAPPCALEGPLRYFTIATQEVVRENPTVHRAPGAEPSLSPLSNSGTASIDRPITLGDHAVLCH